jgi:hypothetical protein
MKRVWVLVLLALSLGGGAFAQPLETLIIDETKTLEESVCVEVLARAMVVSGLFILEARFDIPLGLNPSGKQYDLIVIIPEGIQQLWLVTVDVPTRLPEPFRRALLSIKESATHIFYGTGSCAARRAVDIADDLAPALYATVLAQNGWLR